MEGLQREKFSCRIDHHGKVITGLEYFPYVERIKIKSHMSGCEYQWEIGYCNGKSTGVMDLNFPIIMSKCEKGIEVDVHERKIIQRISLLRNKKIDDYVNRNYTRRDAMLTDKTWKIYLKSNCKGCENIIIDVTVYYYNVL
jgi:hypothetical protein